MDPLVYKDEFISEAREHLDKLNECSLCLERDPNDSESLTKIFRACHTLKGNAASMGFIKYSALAHALEDVLSKIREKEIMPTQNVMDLIFEGFDILEKGLDEISKDNPEAIDSEALIHELKDIINVKEEVADVKLDEKIKLTDNEIKKVQEYKEKGMEIIRLVVVFEKDNHLKSAKVQLILRNISKVTEMIKSNPVLDEIKKGNFNTEVEFLIASQKNKDEISSIINNISGIKHIFVMGPDDSYNKPKETLHEEKERAKQAIAVKHHDDAAKKVQGVRVDMKRLDDLMNLIGELMISNIRLQNIDKKGDYRNMKAVAAGIERLTLNLQDEITEVRMVPIGDIFNRFPRMVRDLARKEGKNVNLIIEGQEIGFDRTVLDEIGEPLVHLLRNCVDHGIEVPEERKKRGKPQEGIVKLIARREKNNAVIEVTDDGAGINPQIVKQSCLRKGMITEEEASKMSDLELQMLVFRAGVSTSKVVTEVSGRGVGMDVAINKVKELGGNLKLFSTVGKGTSVIMWLPLTVAIITVLLVKVKDEVYAIPLSSVDRTVNVKSSQIKTIQGNEVFVLRGKEIPILWLHEIIGLGKFEKKEKATVVIVTKENSQIGLVVDSILSQQQVLIKGLQELVKGTKGVAGATVLGDGSISLIIDIGTML